MNTRSLEFATKLIFGLACGIALFAFLEGFVQLFDTSLISRVYSAGRLLEIAATLMMFVIVLVLLQIRNAIRSA